MKKEEKNKSENFSHFHSIRLTVVVVKARNLRPGNDADEHQKTSEEATTTLPVELKNVYVKVNDASRENDEKIIKF